ncbi:NADPH-dependent F420 reductase [Nonomuraea gerenzanensis]|uniref:Predicted dinucleotide-binding enzymes n=1 Tax=Nonomuraea gerenzanensis TaxID=93944 RepID=A0A1M4EFS6_9ACTN|nr:NAD(P)-binding domain-containing protein [Nonomuraea gerenzanensis]UBU09403.1 NAD(P)-binding domain-containing protein [Nonomuraea gerenzanensis]SBO97817.1 Predicted dinucleotide-binding enzymes [Nonomuraea gerenzanensis]
MPGTLGLIGSGMIGTSLARLAVAAGLEVILSNSRGPQTLAALVAGLGGRARAATPAQAARAADLVVAAIPLKSFARLPAEALAGRTVLDTANYYPERDGHLPELDAGELTSSALLQRHLARSHVVKAFNTITPHQLRTLARPSGAPDRSALPIAGDDAGAKAAATRLLDMLGFDAVDLGPLAESWRSEPDTPVYVRPYLGDVPAMNVADFLAWTSRTPGVAVPAARVRELAGTAVRRPAGAARLPSEG